jgi:hypothetical protein
LDKRLVAIGEAWHEVPGVGARLYPPYRLSATPLIAPHKQTIACERPRSSSGREGEGTRRL